MTTWVPRGLAFFVVLWLSLSAGLAQTTAAPEFERWNRLAKQVEAAVDDNRGTDEKFEDYRRQVAEFRSVFDAARELNGSRIATLREQIAALGPAPEGENPPPEPVDVTAKREELNQQLKTLLEPVQRAEAAFVRADALVTDIDKILRERQAKELQKVVPSPLNPANWKPAYDHLMAAVGVLADEPPSEEGARSWVSLREELPVVLALFALGVVLILRGRGWSKRIVHRLRGLGARGFGIWRFLVSLLRILLPFAGLVMLALAAISTQVFGERSNEILLVLPVLGGAMLVMRWISDRIFSPDNDEALILVAPERRREGRIHVGIITVLTVLAALIELVMESIPSGEAQELVNVIYLPLIWLYSVIVD